ncbi:MAG: VIT1/CCC1 transporter family protein [Phycisphaerales bacterium]
MAERRRLLDPVSRISEILFGLIMALTFTGSLSVATSGREDVRSMLIGAIGCNIAWGLIDAVMYLVTTITARGRQLAIVREVRDAAEPAAGRELIADALSATVSTPLPESVLEAMRLEVLRLPAPPAQPRWTTDDFLGALGVFLLVVVSTFPVVVPFILVRQTSTAMRMSNVIALVMLFYCGYQLGRYSHGRPWRLGFAMAIVGSVLVGITIALGG